MVKFRALHFAIPLAALVNIRLLQGVTREIGDLFGRKWYNQKLPPGFGIKGQVCMGRGDLNLETLCVEGSFGEGWV
jgi:hypothetical protein